MKSFRKFCEDREYEAVVRDKETGEGSVITRSYPSLKDFKHDLRANGYSVLRAGTKEAMADYYAHSDEKDTEEKEKRLKRKSARLEKQIAKRDAVHKKFPLEHKLALFTKIKNTPDGPEKEALEQELLDWIEAENSEYDRIDMEHK